MISKKFSAVTGLILSITWTCAAYAGVSGSFLFEDYNPTYIINNGVVATNDFKLGWQCYSDGLNVVAKHRYMKGHKDGWIDGKGEFDGETNPNYDVWGFLQGQTGSYLAPSEAKDFTRTALNSEVVKITFRDPADGKTITEKFRLNGLAEALQRLPCY